jgi:shikimate kinase
MRSRRTVGTSSADLLGVAHSLLDGVEGAATEQIGRVHGVPGTRTRLTAGSIEYARSMKRVLLTGMSGTGKSTLIGVLAERGYSAVDLDTDEWSEWVPISDEDPFGSPVDAESVWRHRDWVWREDRVARLLATEDSDILFVSGTASNQGKFHPSFDHIILLSAPMSVLMERLSSRTTNTYGKDPSERARILQHVETVEPLLRRAASMEVDTSAALDRMVNTVLDAVQEA